MTLSDKHHIFSFRELVINLVKKNNKQTFLGGEEINNILIDCGLDQEEKVPEWLFQLIEALYNQQIIAPVIFIHPQPNKGDVFNFFSEMEYILEGDWYNYGEYINIILPNLNLETWISFESRNYYIKTIE